MKTLLATTIVATGALVAAPALAQTTMTVVSDDMTVEPFGLSADAVEDLDVRDDAGNEIGEIEDVLGSNDQSPSHLEIDFDDESAYPERDGVIVPIAAITYENDEAVLGLDPQAVSELPRRAED